MKLIGNYSSVLIIFIIKIFEIWGFGGVFLPLERNNNLLLCFLMELWRNVHFWVESFMFSISLLPLCMEAAILPEPASKLGLYFQQRKKTE